MRKATCFGFLMTCLTGLAFSQEDLSSWAHYKDITVNTASSGAGINGDVTGFPLLLRLGSAQADVFAGAKAGGADLRFIRASFPLSYQIDRWDSASQTAEIWVSVDSVKGNNSTQTIRMYWGKPTASAPSGGSAVFDTSKGFLGVWHMGGSAGNRSNSVPGGVPAVPKTATVGNTYQGLSVPGVVGMCDTLRGGIADNATTTPTGMRDYFDVSPVPSFNSFTFSAWVYMAGTSSWFRLFDFGNGEALDNVFLAHMGTSADMMFDVFPSQDALGTGALLTGQWKFFSATLTSDGNGSSAMTFFVDGVVLATGSATNPAEIPRTSSFLGRSNWQDTYYTGKLDEVQVSKVGRSADWVKLSFQNQKTGSTMLTVGATLVPTGLIRGSYSAVTPLRMIRRGNGFVFSLPANRSSDMRLSVLDPWGRSVWSATVQKKDRDATWNGVSSAGNVAAPGLYFVRLSRMTNDNAPAWEGKIIYTR